MRWFKFGWIFALALSVGVSAAAQSLEDDYYEPFDPNAPPLLLRDPELAEIEFYSARTMRVEHRVVDPALLETPNGLEFYLFKVGQADAMLVVGPAPQRRTLLVDLGVAREEGFAGRFSAQHVGQRILDITRKRQIDYFVLSHFHSDHFGSGNSGITALISHGGFTVGTMIDTGPIGAQYVKRSPSAREYIERQDGWVREGKVGSVQRPRFGTGQIDLGSGVSVDIVAFAGRFGDDDEGVHARYERRNPGHYGRAPTSENDLSIAMRIALGDFEFWTAGDLSGASGNGTAALSGSSRNYTNIEWPMVQHWRQQGRERDVEVYRANHHGSGYSSTRQLLAAGPSSTCSTVRRPERQALSTARPTKSVRSSQPPTDLKFIPTNSRPRSNARNAPKARCWRSRKCARSPPASTSTSSAARGSPFPARASTMAQC